MAESNPPPSFSSSSAFVHSITEKLTDSNFLQWRQQVEPVIKVHQLHRYLVCPNIPLRYASEADQDLGTVNPACTAWEIQDQMLLTWLQSSLCRSILSCILGSADVFQVWEKIHNNNQKLTKAKVCRLRTELWSTTLDNKSVSKFLLRIKALADALASVEDPITLEQHVDVILEGLPSNYNSVIKSKFKPMLIEEVEALLLVNEMQLKKWHKKLASETASLNLTGTSSSGLQQQSSSSSQAHAASEPVNSNYNSYSSFRGSGRGHGGRNSHGGSRGRGDRFPNVQC